MTVMHYYQGSEYRVVSTGVSTVQPDNIYKNIVGTLPSNQRVIFGIATDNNNSVTILTPSQIYYGPGSYLGGIGDGTTRFPENTRQVQYCSGYGGSLKIKINGGSYELYVTYMIIERI